MTMSLLVGIVAGLLSMVLFVLLRRAWLRYLLPLVDKTTAIEGDWIADTTFPDGEKNRHRITLHRFGHTIWGQGICEEGWGKGFRYKISGTFKNLVLAAQYEVKGQQRLERGSFTLMLVEGGSRLVGYLAYLDNDTNKIATTATEWRAQEVPSPRPDLKSTANAG